MICNHCEKFINGGFKQDDNTFLCAKCVIIKVERATELKQFAEIAGLCDMIIYNKKKRPTKKQVREIRMYANSIVQIRKSSK